MTSNSNNKNNRPKIHWIFHKWRCKALIVGGGTGGCAIGAKLSSDFGQNECIILEPASQHYYQPMFTLIGGGIKTLAKSRRSMESVLPRKAKWIKDAAAEFRPNSNEVITKGGHTISYDFLVIAVGLQLNYNKVSCTSESTNNQTKIQITIFQIDSRSGGSAIDSKWECHINLLTEICWPAFECTKTISKWKYSIHISCVTRKMSWCSAEDLLHHWTLFTQNK